MHVWVLAKIFRTVSCEFYKKLVTASFLYASRDRMSRKHKGAFVYALLCASVSRAASEFPAGTGAASASPPEADHAAALTFGICTKQAL